MHVVAAYLMCILIFAEIGRHSGGHLGFLRPHHDSSQSPSIFLHLRYVSNHLWNNFLWTSHAHRQPLRDWSIRNKTKQQKNYRNAESISQTNPMAPRGRERRTQTKTQSLNTEYTYQRSQPSKHTTLKQRYIGLPTIRRYHGYLDVMFSFPQRDD